MQHPIRIEALEHARLDFGLNQVTDPPQYVVKAVAVGGAHVLRDELEVGLHGRQGATVDQVAELLLAQQLAQQVAIERQRRRPPLGVGDVPLVHVGGHIVEQQAGSERRGRRCLHLHQRHLPPVDPGQELHETRNVEHVAKALSVGLEHDRKVIELLGDLEQRLGLQALLPEGRALSRAGARDQQGPASVLTKACPEQGGGGELGDHAVLDLVGVEQYELGVRGVLGVR